MALKLIEAQYVTIKIVQNDATDGTRTRVTPLRTANADNQEEEATANNEKAKILYSQFFREEPAKAQMDIPRRPRYKTAFDFEPIREDQLTKETDSKAGTVQSSGTRRHPKCGTQGM